MAALRDIAQRIPVETDRRFRERTASIIIATYRHVGPYRVYLI